MSPSSHNKKKRGFSLLEVLVAITVLTIGLISVGALATTMLATGKRSKYMALASTLASEKLEDLNRYPADAPQVCIPSGQTSVGSIPPAADYGTVSTTCPTNGATSSVPYQDDVDISFGSGNSNCPADGGCFAEQITSVTNGTTYYTTTYHSPTGIVTSTAASNTSSTQTMTFHRQWLIEGDTPVAGVRRVTVAVSMVNKTVNPPVKFQMSTVRP
ncbi:MAG TPA: prepilin-type N-terminal cleavage/methylation domain-containing protein [Terriglobales bacterium]|nr:prepilin-type N-terminal cleavage/methylation domain-containing protein [Terriglobales bacterium]